MQSLSARLGGGPAAPVGGRVALAGRALPSARAAPVLRSRGASLSVSAKRSLSYDVRPYTVRPNDNLGFIANRFNCDVELIRSLNPQIKANNVIYRGDVVQVPVFATRGAAEPKAAAPKPVAAKAPAPAAAAKKPAAAVRQTQVQPPAEGGLGGYASLAVVALGAGATWMAATQGLGGSLSKAFGFPQDSNEEEVEEAEEGRSDTLPPDTPFGTPKRKSPYGMEEHRLKVPTQSLA